MLHYLPFLAGIGSNDIQLMKIWLLTEREQKNKDSFIVPRSWALNMFKLIKKFKMIPSEGQLKNYRRNSGIHYIRRFNLIDIWYLTFFFWPLTFDIWNSTFCFQHSTLKLYKHHNNCECCPVSLLIVRYQRLSWIQVLNFQKCNQCLKCH